jgi:hypothetical protein
MLLRSSQRNAEIARENFPNSPFLRFIFTSTGDEIPDMRDEILWRKNRGENLFWGSIRSYFNPRNWIVRSDNNAKEEEHPARALSWLR